MHPLHAQIATTLAKMVADHRVVVWYDPRREFLPFVDELAGTDTHGTAPVAVSSGHGAIGVAIVKATAAAYCLVKRDAAR